jgi:phosphohistidine phosphatase
MNERFEALEAPSLTITEVDDLYLARWKVYVDELSARLTSDTDTVMVLGHCPGVEDLVEALTDQWVTMPTATIARLSYNHDSWADLKKKHRKHFQLEDLWLPKEILD